MRRAVSYVGALLQVGEIESSARWHGNGGEDDSRARGLRLACGGSTPRARESTSGSSLVDVWGSSWGRGSNWISQDCSSGQHCRSSKDRSEEHDDGYIRWVNGKDEVMCLLKDW